MAHCALPLRKQWDGVHGMSEAQRVTYRQLQRKQEGSANRGVAHALVEMVLPFCLKELLWHALPHPKGGRKEVGTPPRMPVPLVAYQDVIGAAAEVMPVATAPLVEEWRIVSEE